MRSFKTRPLSTLLLLGLLSWITYVLIAPEIDLDDFAIRSKDSPLAIHALPQHVLQGNASIAPPRITFPATDFSGLALVAFIHKAVEVPSDPPRILRC
jgi:hypothetical protein